MSRTFRTNKYGEVKTDKFKKDFNGCGCVYCEFMSFDSRNKHNELFKDNEIKENVDYLRDRYEDLQYEEKYYLDTISTYLLYL